MSIAISPPLGDCLRLLTRSSGWLLSLGECLLLPAVQGTGGQPSSGAATPVLGGISAPKGGRARCEALGRHASEAANGRTDGWRCPGMDRAG